MKVNGKRYKEFIFNAFAEEKEKGNLRIYNEKLILRFFYIYFF